MLELEKNDTISETEIKNEREVEIGMCRIPNCCHKMFRYVSEGVRSSHQLDPDGDYFRFDFDKSLVKVKESTPNSALKHFLRKHFEECHENDDNDTLPEFIKRSYNRCKNKKQHK